MDRYRAFISYSHSDEAIARWLHRALETYRLPKRVLASMGVSAERLTPIFRDRDELASSSDLSESIKQALLSSDALIVICSPSAAASKWVNAEIETFRAAGDKPVLCVLSKNKEVAASDCFPLSLRTESGEPLAADLGVDGKRGAKLKIVAGLLGIGLDVLIQRDAQRRVRRLTLAAAASTAAMVFAVALASYAFLAQQRAETAQSQAETEAQRAKDLTDFLLDMFDATSPADTRGADISARELLARGASEIDVNRMDPQARVRINHALGRAYLKLQLLDDATSHLHDARAGLDDIGDEELAIDVETDAVFLLMYQREFAEADTALSNLIIRARNAFGPRDRRTLSLTGNLATAKLYQGDVEAAEELMIAAYDGLYESLGPSDELTMRTQAALAVLYARTGRNDEAIKVQEEVVRLQQEILGEDHPQTIDSVDNLATFYMRKQDWPSAVQIGLEGLALNERVFGADSPAVAHVKMNLTYALIELGDLDAAEVHGRDAVNLADKYYGANHPITLIAVENLAESLYRQGKLDESSAMMSGLIDRLQDEIGDEDTRTVRAVVANAAMPFLAGDEAEASLRLDRMTWDSAVKDVWRDLREEFDEAFAQFVDAEIGAD